MQKLLTFVFSKNISAYAIFNAQSFNDMLTNDIVSFEQVSPDIFSYISTETYVVVCIRSAYVMVLIRSA